jgi:cytochrome c-type biogenesis protein CcmH/NrfF
MTITIAALAVVTITAALLWEEWSWKRQQRKQAARRAVPPVRCMVCPGSPMVDDFRTHSRLAHGPRVPAPEDSREWAS